MGLGIVILQPRPSKQIQPEQSRQARLLIFEMHLCFVREERVMQPEGVDDAEAIAKWRKEKR